MDGMSRLLLQFVRSAQAMGATPEETMAAMAEMSGSIYSVEISGAETGFERRRAHAALVRGYTRAVEDLPTEKGDAKIEAKLRKKGFYDGRTR